MLRPTSLCRRIALMTVALCVALPAASASAGRVVVTGHDADHHCGRSGPGDAPQQCDFVKAATDYVRAGAPDPSRPVLVLDRGELDVSRSLDLAYGPGVVPRRIVDPRTELAGLPITTDLYSAVIVASSKGDVQDGSPQDLNELEGQPNSTPDSDAINARIADLRAFYDAGGGIYANSGNQHGNGPGDPYYAFLPLNVGATNNVAPYRLTDVGRALGLTDGTNGTSDDVNCCETHNGFSQPDPGSPLGVAETDDGGNVVTLSGQTATFSQLAESTTPTTTAQIEQQVASGLPSAKSCVRRSSISLRLRRPKGIRFRTATVYVNGRKQKTVRGSKITRPIKVRLRPSGTSKVRIAITTTKRRKLTIRRSYKACA